jgi:uncharacterized protein (TIGR00266 family)
MKFNIDGNPDYGDLTVVLEPGESIWTESGAMSRMSSHLSMKSHVIGGPLQGLVRKFLGGQSLFVGEYTASQMGFVGLSPAYPGCVLHRKIGSDTLWLTAGSFLACTPGMQIRPRFGGFKALFSSEGVVLLEVSGSGDLFYSAFGAVIEREIDGEFTVDTGHVVAWEPTLDYTIGGMGGLKQTLFSGEGLVMRFAGHGRIWLQTRHLPSLAGWLAPYCSV